MSSKLLTSSTPSILSMSSTYSSMCRQYLVQEELTYLTTIQYTFEQTWGEINLGERIMADYIRFCGTKKDFSFEFIQLCNKQLRWELGSILSLTSSFPGRDTWTSSAPWSRARMSPRPRWSNCSGIISANLRCWDMFMSSIFRTGQRSCSLSLGRRIKTNGR